MESASGVFRLAAQRFWQYKGNAAGIGQGHGALVLSPVREAKLLSLDPLAPSFFATWRRVSARQDWRIAYPARFPSRIPTELRARVSKDSRRQAPSSRNANHKKKHE